MTMKTPPNVTTALDRLRANYEKELACKDQEIEELKLQIAELKSSVSRPPLTLTPTSLQTKMTTMASTTTTTPKSTASASLGIGLFSRTKKSLENKLSLMRSPMTTNPKAALSSDDEEENNDSSSLPPSASTNANTAVKNERKSDADDFPPSTTTVTPSLLSSTTPKPPTTLSETLTPLCASSINSHALALMTAAGASLHSARPIAEPIHATNFAIINEREDGLVKGPAFSQNLHYASHERLFQQTFEVEWVEDSPGFRHKLHAIDENVEGLRKHMLRLVSICRKYCDLGQQFTETGRELAGEMMHLQGESWFTRLGELAPSLVRFGETLGEIQNYREALLVSLETTFSVPMEQFVRREVKEVKKKRYELQRNLEEYENDLSRYLLLKNNEKQDIIDHHETKIAHSKRAFELVRFDLVNLLNQLEIKKKFQLVERICSGLYANLGFFHQCHTLVATREPSMRELQGHLKNARCDFAKTERLWSAKRTQLEMELSVGSFPRPRFATTDIMKSQGKSSASSISLTGDNVVKHGEEFHLDEACKVEPDADFAGDCDIDLDSDIDIDAQVVADRNITEIEIENENAEPGSAITSESDKIPTLKTTATTRLSDIDKQIGIVKHGYLWKRSNNMKRDWKRRWFIIQGGKLKYQRQEELSITGPPVTVCDIMLCTIREFTSPFSTRFTFEIVSPNNRAYTCKAENETDYNDWIGAIRAQTEMMLVEGMARNNIEGGDRTCLSTGSLPPSGITTLGIPQQDIVDEILNSNKTCADCNNKDPSWASINLGVMICIQCSGIHRSIGVHISKVRSLKLDDWSKSMLMVMQKMGNDRFNEIYEEGVIPGRDSKPKGNCSREEAEKWIHRKYVEKAFVRGVEGDVNEQLFRCAGEGNYALALKCLAVGADVNFISPNSLNKQATLHNCMKSLSLVTLELLCSNGANLDAEDENGLNILDYAMETGNSEVISFTVAKLEGMV